MRSIFLFAGVIFSNILFSQITEGWFYAFKEDGSSTKDLETASYFMHKIKDDDTTYICRFFQKNGPMIRWETYYDKNLDIPNGRFAWYNNSGGLNSTGSTYRGKKDGAWEYFIGDTSQLSLSEHYYRGKFLKRENFIENIVQYADGITETEMKTDSTNIIIPASYKGGLRAWQNYLTSEVKIPDRFVRGSTSGNFAKVVVNFMINKEGRVSDIFIKKSTEWSVDTEAIRVIKKSIDWKPAYQYGKPIIYWKQQSISFGTN